MLALAMLAAVTPAAAPAEDEIVVIARKMRFIKVDMKAPVRHGRLALERCRITRGSGYAELDAVPCDTAQACMAEGVTTRAQLVQCTEQRAQVRLDQIAAAWRAARPGSR